MQHIHVSDSDSGARGNDCDCDDGMMAMILKTLAQVEFESSLPLIALLNSHLFLSFVFVFVSWQIWNKLFCSTDFLLTSTDFCWLYTDHHHHQITLVVYQRDLEIVQPEPAGRGDSSTIQVKKKLNKFFLTNYTKF